MNIAYIMRGVPGSGKSTLARVLVQRVGVIHSTDDYFFVDGVYVFRPEKLREHHAMNLAAFCQSLKAGIPIVICDNTNIRLWEFELYEQAAREAGYVVVIVTVPHPTPEVAAGRNIHHVPATVIQGMINRWEKY